MVRVTESSVEERDQKACHKEQPDWWESWQNPTTLKDQDSQGRRISQEKEDSGGIRVVVGFG